MRVEKGHPPTAAPEGKPQKKPSEQDAKIHEIAKENIQGHESKSVWRWVVSVFASTFNFFYEAICSLFDATIKKPDDIKTDVPQDSKTKEYEGSEVVDSVSNLLKTYSSQASLVSAETKAINLKEIKADKLQHLVGICYELEEHRGLAADLLEQIDKDDSKRKEDIRKLIEGMDAVNLKLFSKLKDHQKTFEAAVNEELDEIEAIVAVAELLPHQRTLISEIGRGKGLIHQNLSTQTIKRSKDIQAKIPAKKSSPDDSPESKRLSIGAPVGFTNLTNSCYMNSTLQTLLSMPAFVEIIKNDLERLERELPDDFAKRKEMHQLLRQLVHATEQPDPSAVAGFGENVVDQILFELRAAVFRAGKEDFASGGLLRQQDALALVSLFMEVLGFDIPLQERKVFENNGDTTTSREARYVGSPVISLAFSNGDNQLQNMLKGAMNEQRDLPKPHIAKKTFITNPDSLYLHVGRNIEGAVENQVQVPKNLTLDFTESSATKGLLQYQIKGFVVHLGGSLHSGHYISYVERNGQWYKCNDSSIRKAKMDEIQKEVQQAYLLTLQKV